MREYLQSSPLIDWQAAAIRQKAAELTSSCLSQREMAEKCFHFVRDQIAHSWDVKRGPVTCKASDVLTYGTGYCYAKSHLLAALLRASGIPAGLCYQRLTIEGDRPPFCLHSLNAVYLPQYGWYRMDARGNKPGVSAEFCPPREQLAFLIQYAGEADLPHIYAEPLPSVVKVLTENATIEGVYRNLPCDI